MSGDRPALTYILPIRRQASADESELTAYLREVARLAQLVVVDGSPPDVFAHHAQRWAPFAACHVPPDPDPAILNGKVRGVLTGLRLAACERIVIADDDVRYDAAGLRAVAALLDDAEVVRPQNYFDPRPWHARWDTARSLLNRLTGGDWPGTLAVRRSALRRTGGYDGRVLFENLELVRTVIAAGGRELVPLDLYVRRLPPDARHFWSQRVRQAYDELARPLRLAVWLAVLPVVVGLALAGRWRGLFLLAAATVGQAEAGRRRAGGRTVFPWSAALLAPAWVAERAICSWLALALRAAYGGVPYHGTVIARPATPMRELRRRYGTSRAMPSAEQKAAPPAAGRIAWPGARRAGAIAPARITRGRSRHGGQARRRRGE